MNSGLTSQRQRGHTETALRFKDPSERPELRGIDLEIPGLVESLKVYIDVTNIFKARACLFQAQSWVCFGSDENRICRRAGVAGEKEVRTVTAQGRHLFYRHEFLNLHFRVGRGLCSAMQIKKIDLFWLWETTRVQKI